MPRRPRVNLVGYPQHVVQRGHNREACFFADEDYLFYLHWLREGAKKYGCTIHAYALMTNHVHLLATPQAVSGLSHLMQSLGRRYAQYVNRTYRRSGSVWEGRFKASLIHAENYLLKCYRDIELNPVRADMVRDPGEYRWSSYMVNAQGKPSTLITPHAEYLALGRDEVLRRQRYAALFKAEIDDVELKDIRAAVNGGYAFGRERFKVEIAVALGRRVAPTSGGRPASGSARDDKQQELSL
jgi:putative transposase